MALPTTANVLIAQAWAPLTPGLRDAPTSTVGVPPTFVVIPPSASANDVGLDNGCI